MNSDEHVSKLVQQQEDTARESAMLRWCYNNTSGCEHEIGILQDALAEMSDHARAIYELIYAP